MPHPGRRGRSASGAVGEMLANLRSGTDSAGPPHPARVSDARARATLAAREEEESRAHALDAWLAVAERELKRLPDQLTDGISDRDSRIGERRRLAAMG